MSEKPKRKRGSGRIFKTLFFATILISLMIALSSIAINLLRSHGPYFVYLAPNEHGFSTLWKADLENPEHSKQLVFFPPNVSVHNYQITDNGRYIVYSFAPMGSSISYTHLLDTQTGRERQLNSCHVEQATCSRSNIRPDGRYIVYSKKVYGRTLKGEINVDSMNVHVIDTDTFSDKIVYEFDLSNPNNWQHYSQFSWVGNTGLLTFTLGGEPFNFQVFDVGQNTSVETLPLGVPVRSPIFSPDGSRYAYYQSEIDMEPRVVEVRETNSPETPISIYQEWTSELLSDGWLGSYIYDWNPDNEHLLISINYYGTDPSIHYSVSNLQLLNTTDNTVVVLTEGKRFSYEWATFNHDGSKILYQRKDTWGQCMDICDQIMIYDMETGEHTALPIVGKSPQWVNGGRG